MRQYTADNNRFIFNKIEDINNEMIQGINESAGIQNFSALVLAGGYGRGEGGIYKSDGSVHLYNDMEYYLFLAPGARCSARELQKIHDFADFLTDRHHIKIELRVVNHDWLESEPVSIFTYDLVTKSHVVHGSEDFLSEYKNHQDSALIPVSEAERLLYNRLSGILFSLEKLNKPTLTSEDSDFIGRNIAKLKLAMGDACLTIFGNYHWSSIERNKALKALFEHWVLFDAETQQTVMQYHDEGLRFKLHPETTSKQPAAWAEEIDRILEIAQPIWKWSQNESQEQKAIRIRMGAHDNMLSAIRERLKNVRYFGLSDTVNPYNRLSGRERLQKCLWDLILRQRYQWMEFQNNRVQKLLNLLPREGTSLVHRYQLLWSRLS